MTNQQPKGQRPVEALRLATEVDEVSKIYPDMAEVSSELRRLHEVNQMLLEALKDSATSLETINRIAGKLFYLGEDGEKIRTNMRYYDEVRGYAKSRATVARTAIAKAGEQE